MVVTVQVYYDGAIEKRAKAHVGAGNERKRTLDRDWIHTVQLWASLLRMERANRKKKAVWLTWTSRSCCCICQ